MPYIANVGILTRPAPNFGQVLVEAGSVLDPSTVTPADISYLLAIGAISGP
jgi:hypothetical protein